MNRSLIALLAVAAEVADDPPAPVVVARRRVSISDSIRQQFEGVLTFIGTTIAKMNNNYRESISPAQRLCICLRYLSTGDSYRSIAFSYRGAVQSIPRVGSNNASREAVAVRETFNRYFSSLPGRVTWQDGI
ncbi:unnamed protein product [Arctogadus glacialis]